MARITGTNGSVFLEVLDRNNPALPEESPSQEAEVVEDEGPPAPDPIDAESQAKAAVPAAGVAGAAPLRGHKDNDGDGKKDYPADPAAARPPTTPNPRKSRPVLLHGPPARP